MSDPSSAMKNLRERLTGASEDHLGKALSDLLDNPLLTGTIGRAFDAREKAAQAQELAMGALNIPSAADIERLTRRLRSVSQRLEGIEDGVHRLDRALSARGVDSTQIGERLSKIEEQLGTLAGRLGQEKREVKTGASRSRTAQPSGSKSKPKAPKSRRTSSTVGSRSKAGGSRGGSKSPESSAKPRTGGAPPRSAG